MTSPHVHSAAQVENVKGQPSTAGEEGEMETINPEVWYACGGPMAELPPAESMVVYFPQGHYQQVAGLVPHMPNYLNLPSKLICLFHSANLHADRVTDEVYAQMTLHPRKHDEEALLLSENVMKQIRPQADSCYSQTDFYCWTLRAIDVITNDGISIPYHVAEELFPPLDFSMHIPSQYLRAMDLHGNLWIFRHVYRGQPKGHFLTIGWSKFVSAKNLFAGDSVLFIRDATQQLVLGIRRARAASRYSPVLSNCSMDTGILAEAVHAAANRSPFTILYYPRAAPSSFVIPFAKYQKAVYSYQIFLGMRLSMRFEIERTRSKIYFGTLTGISDLDPLQWKNSEWKQLQVLWDESTSCERQNRVSVWEIEPLLDPELPIMQDNKVSEMENISVKATSSTEPQSKMENISVKATPSTKPQNKVYKTLNGPARDILEKNGVVEDLRQLDRMLTRMRAMLNDAEQREIDEEAVKLWLRELKCVAGDAEDILDEYRYELLRCQIEIQKASTVLSSCGKRKFPDDYSASSSSFQHGKVTIPDGLSDKIKEIRSRFDEISGDREALRLTVEDGEKKVGGTGSVNYPLPTSHLVDKSSIFGRRDDKKKIMELVLSGEQDLFRVIPIIGMGGIGKTTLAQMVYDDPMVHATFDVRAWIYVSPEFDVIRISKEISEFVTGKPGDGFDGFSKVQEEIQKSLIGKKLLLVLDDMWIEQKNCWEMLLFPLRAAKMVRVLVTTRNESVAKIVQTVTPQHLGLLPYNECWQLFMHCVYGYTEMRYSRLSLIGKQIIEKCGGLPLALKCIGGLLRFKKDEDSWMEIMESELWESYECDKVFCALKVSYSHLDPNLKRCFLFCSLFPKGSLLKRIEIIYMWMAHGYIQPREGQRAEDLAEKYLSELCMRSFILFHKKNSFILHDVIYDLGRSLSTKEIHTIMDDKPCHISDEIRHVYVKNGNNPCYSFNRVCRVRTFLNATICDIGCLRVLGLMGSNVHMLASSGCRLKNLRYLGIRQIDLKELPESICLFYHLEALTMASCYKLIKLPINIGNLVNLRYFHLSHAGIEELPDTFCKLYNLQTLHLEECNNLRELPKDIGILSSLRMLRLKSCKCIKRLPSGIKKLNNLMILDVRGFSNLHGIFESIGDLLLRFHLGKLHIMHEDLVKTADSRLDGDHRGFKLYEGSKRMLAHGRNTSISSHDQSDCSYSSPFSMTQIDVSDGRNTWMSPYDQSDCYDIMSFSEMFLYDGVDRLEFSPNKKN